MRSVRSLVVAVLAPVVLVAPAAVFADGRVALVVGNGTYVHIGRLPNPDNDARNMSAALRRLGFEVTTELDAQSTEFLPQTTNLGTDKEGRVWYVPILYMLSQVWIGPRDGKSSSRAALPMRYSATRQQTDHPLRVVRGLTDEALRTMSTQLERLYSTTGRPSSPPEQFAARTAVPGALQGPQRTAADGRAGLQPAVPLVRRVEHGDPSDTRRRG